MQAARLLFSTSDRLFSAMIRAATWSDWSHVAIVDGDTVIEAAAPHGVRRISLASSIEHSSKFVIVDLPCRDPRAIIEAASSQIGKPYDWTAILGLSLRRNWQEDDAWFCSELTAWSFHRAGSPLFRAECLRRVTPQHIYMLPSKQHAIGRLPLPTFV